MKSLVGVRRRRVSLPKFVPNKRKVNKPAAKGGRARATDAKFGKPSQPVKTVTKRKKKKNVVNRSETSTAKYVKKGRKVTPQDGYRVSQKVEKGQNFIGFNAIYPGGATHPAYVTLRTLSMALVRFIAKKANVDFGDWNDGVALPFVPFSKWEIFYYWKAEGPTSIDQPSFRAGVDANSAATWAILADILAGSLAFTFGQTTGRRLYYFGVCPNDGQTTTQSFMSTQGYHASDLYISIKGESAIQAQNRTLADGSGDTADASNIFNNPLRGKYYTFSNGRPMLRNVASAPANKNTIFEYSSDSGHIATQDRYGTLPVDTDFSPEVALSLRKPPPGNAFKNCKTTKYTTVIPGGILRSKIDFTVNKSLTDWMFLFAPKLLAGSNSLVAVKEPDPVGWTVGASHCFGLEKMVDTQVANSPELQIGLEHNLYQVGRVTYKPKNTVLPMISITT